MSGNVIGLTLDTIAKWPEGNYADAERKTWMPAYAGVLFTVGTLMIATRLWLRAKKMAGGLGADDAMMCIAWLGSTVFFVATILCTTTYHADRAVWDIPTHFFVPIAQMMWIGELSFLFAQCCIKLSVLLLYRRLVTGEYSRRYITAIYLGMALTTVYSVAFMFVIIFDCRPVDAYWKAFNFTYEAEGGYTCLQIETTVVNISCGVLGAITDLYVVFLPFALTRSLGLKRRQAIALNFVFSLGLIATAAGGARTYYLWQIGTALDITGSIFHVLAWASLELQLGIMCASAPAFRVFLRSMVVGTVKNHASYLSSRSKSRQSRQEILDDIEARPIKSDVNHRRQSSSPDFMADDLAKDCTTARIEEVEVDPPHMLTPHQYVLHNLKTIEESRQSVTRAYAPHPMFDMRPFSPASGQETREAGRTQQ